jgi:hypothetical protein
LAEGSDGTVAATASRTTALSAAQIANVVRQLVALSSSVPSGMPTTVAIEMPDITTAAARPACFGATMRMAMPTPIAQKTPLAKPISIRVPRISG